MEIDVRKISEKYREVKVYDQGLFYFNLGLLSRKECFDLADELQQAIDSLCENWIDKHHE